MMRMMAKIVLVLVLVLALAVSSASTLFAAEDKSNGAVAVVDPETLRARLDVYDSFFITEGTSSQFGARVSLAIIDGFRQIVGSCDEAATLRPGDARTTWLSIEYSPILNSADWRFAVTRTLNFSDDDNGRRYEFTLTDDGKALALDAGLYVYLDRGKLIYIQKEGVIGPNGRNSLEFEYELAKSAEISSGNVKIGSSAWSFEIARDRTEFLVNDTPIEANYVEQRLATAGGATLGSHFGLQSLKDVVTPPTQIAPRSISGDPRLMQVADEDAPSDGVEETSDETLFPCLALGCDTGTDCQYWPTCQCIKMGPGLRVCGQ